MLTCARAEHKIGGVREHGAPGESREGASVPNRLWVSDFTYVASWSGVVDVAFAIDAFSRWIVGWKADTTMKTSLVLDTLEMELWARDHSGQPVLKGLVAHSDAGSQYTSFAVTQRLIDAGADPSIGSVGDGYDNALAERTIRLYKTELWSGCVSANCFRL